MNAGTSGTETKAGSRAEAQRDRILCAAQKCFIEHGFHAASVASIAQAAQMSAGLMYRYFANKNAIVLAIIARELEERRSGIRQLHLQHDVAQRVLSTFEQWCVGDPRVMNAALFLEMSAEAKRNPQIAVALRSADVLTRAELQAWLGRDPGEGGLGLSQDLTASRALLLQCVIEGIAVRAVREPDLDPGKLQFALDTLFGCLFP